MPVTHAHPPNPQTSGSHTTTPWFPSPDPEHQKGLPKIPTWLRGSHNPPLLH